MEDVSGVLRARTSTRPAGAAPLIASLRGDVCVRPLRGILAVGPDFGGVRVRVALGGCLCVYPLILHWIFAHACS
ncbi:hypothetical protein ARTHRO9AX_220161 [Arthrobacter sp. 9AX]|nr:hypothetical protein ARTHRO9AX_220161 [Arthrobacter sp. 9AX]